MQPPGRLRSGALLIRVWMDTTESVGDDPSEQVWATIHSLPSPESPPERWRTVVGVEQLTRSIAEWLEAFARGAPPGRRDSQVTGK